MENIQDNQQPTKDPKHHKDPRDTTERAKYCFRTLLKKYRDSKEHLSNTKKPSVETQESLEVGELTLKYLPFILTRVKKAHVKHYRRYSFDELLEEALLASLMAEKRYNPKLGWDFSTYAKYDVEGALTKFTSSLSNTQLVLYNKMIKFIEKYSSETGKHPSKASILKGLSISEEKYTHLLQDLEPPILVPYMRIQEDSIGQEEVEQGMEDAVQESDVLVHDILKIIKNLESPTKEIIEMSVIQEMSIDSLAIFLGVTKQVAQGRIDSAKAELRDILELKGITND